LSGELVEEEDEIGVFVWVRNEDVALEKSGNGLVFVAADADSKGISQTGSLQALDF
jgi:hypothetical protein